MSNDKDNLKPLSFESEGQDKLNPIGDEGINDDSFVSITETSKLDIKNLNPIGDEGINDDSFVSITETSKLDIKNKSSNFICLFGSPQSGKSVILCSLLYYLKARAGVLRPTKSTPNSKETQVLLSQFFDNISRGILPPRTTVNQIARFDFTFEPSNKSKKTPSINITFLDTAGDNNNEIRRGGQFNTTLEEYLNAEIPITFIVVTSWEKAHQEDTFISEFFDELEKKGKNLKYINLVFVVSKWDKSGKNYASEEELEFFFKQRLPMTNNLIETNNLARTFYTIGNVSEDNKVTKLELDTATVLGKWIYESITGYSLDYEGTFWEQIKSSIFGK